MRRIYLNMTMSLDGFFAGPNDELDWMTGLSDPQLVDDTVAFFNQVDSGFIGYPTASGMIPYWRSVAANPGAPEEERRIAEAVNKLRPYIISNRDAELELAGAELLRVRDENDLAEAVVRIKNLPGKDLGVPGGIRTAQAFSRLGLIDEYVLVVLPVLLGQGRRAFEKKGALDLLETKRYSSGAVRVRYRPV